MGLRFRKSINLGGGFRVNLSKSGLGYSWGTKGYRITKTATGKTRKTYSIPGTGISYVDEKGKSSNKNRSSNNDFTYNESNKKRMPTMNNIIKIILGLLFIILFTYFTPGLILGAIAIIIYYITHRQAFMEKSIAKKLGICVLIFFLVVSGIAYSPNKSGDIQQDEYSVSDHVKDSDIQPFASIPETLPKDSHIDEEPNLEIEPEVTSDPAPDNTPPTVTTPSEPKPKAEVIPPEIKAPTAAEVTVYITDTGTKYHKDGCRFLKDSKYETTLQQVTADGYEACKVCKPPVK